MWGHSDCVAFLVRGEHLFVESNTLSRTLLRTVWGLVPHCHQNTYSKGIGKDIGSPPFLPELAVWVAVPRLGPARLLVYC